MEFIAISRDNAYMIVNIDLTTAMTYVFLEVRNLHKSLFINIVCIWVHGP